MIKGSFKNRIGEKHITKEGCEVEIINCTHNSDCTIKFLDTEYIKYNVDFADIMRGEVKNPYHPSVFNVGFIGLGVYKTKEDYKMTPYYKKWTGILKRVYGNTKHYEGVTICKEWYNFQVFAEWFYENYNPETMKEWQLDKDILIKGNKVYSPKTCCFVPQEINNLFTKNNKNRGDYPIGVTLTKNNIIMSNLGNVVLYRGNDILKAFQAYKVAKECRIKKFANKWKDQISSKVYNALINYKVEITD
jgi:hypothetical protein